jgi:hypothetical protein
VKLAHECHGQHRSAGRIRELPNQEADAISALHHVDKTQSAVVAERSVFTERQKVWFFLAATNFEKHDMQASTRPRTTWMIGAFGSAQ